MGESRQELLAWLNNLLQLNVTKVEQCGTGAALCQVFDSIYQDLPMSKVKFNVNTEYAYLQNFKILQNCFSKQKIERPIPVESLVKCKMQDNLEFLQWSKRFWDQYYPGGDYDAIARRKGSGAPPIAPPTTVPASRTANSSAARRGGTTPTTAPVAGVRPAKWGVGAGAGAAAGVSAAVVQENAQLKETLNGLERERDFYFSKLRDIELLIQTEVEADPAAEAEADEGSLVKKIQAILYSTEEGFEIPAEIEEAVPDDQETF